MVTRLPEFVQAISTIPEKYFEREDRRGGSAFGERNNAAVFECGEENRYPRRIEAESQSGSTASSESVMCRACQSEWQCLMSGHAASWPLRVYVDSIPYCRSAQSVHYPAPDGSAQRGSVPRIYERHSQVTCVRRRSCDPGTRSSRSGTTFPDKR